LALQLTFIDSLRLRLFTAIAQSRWNYLNQRHSSELFSTLTTDIQRVGLGTHFLLQLVTVLIISSAYWMTAFLLSPQLTGLALGVGLLLWGILRQTQQAARRSGVFLSQANQNLFAQIQEFLAALKLIKIHAEESESEVELGQALSETTQQQLDFRKMHTQAQALYRIGGAMGLAGLVYWALTQTQISSAYLLALIAIFARMLPQLSVAQLGVAQLWHMLPAYQNWSVQLALCLENSDSLQSNGVQPKLTEAIRLEQVRYRHPNGHHQLDVVSLQIPAYQTTAIIGPSGSGKTTLLDLLSGLNSPDHGKILIDDQNLNQVQRGWRQTLAYVPQETVIIDGTVRSNLHWGNQPIADEILWDALSQAAAADFVRSLPHGLATTVGERGVKLSGGERQRLALARALLRRPQVLILDEATSALDTTNQRLILEAIRKLHGQMTVLMVTHRHEELEGLVDGRVFVDQGQVSCWQARSLASGGCCAHC
jgi:ATP-binding cassette subfamily C protein